MSSLVILPMAASTRQILCPRPRIWQGLVAGLLTLRLLFQRAQCFRELVAGLLLPSMSHRILVNRFFRQLILLPMGSRLSHAMSLILILGILTCKNIIGHMVLLSIMSLAGQQISGSPIPCL